MSSTNRTSRDSRIFGGDGEVAHLGRSFDWSETKLGPPAQWPDTLRSVARLVLESRLPMTLAWGPDLVQIYNDGYLPILGSKHPEALGRPARESYSEIWEEVGPLLESVLRTGQAVWRKDQCLMIERCGLPKERYFTFSYSPVRDSRGECLGVLSAAVETTHEVMERRQTVQEKQVLEQRHSDAEKRYQAVFENSLDAMFLTSPDGPVLAANSAACALLGYTEEEICENGRAGLVDFDDERIYELIAQRREAGEFQGEMTLLHRDGHSIPVEVSTKIYLDAHGNRRTSMVMRDIRGRIELESELQQAQKLEVVGKLAGGIAHDFNNLLTVIQSSAQFLSGQFEADSEEAEDVRVIVDASKRAAALTSRLLAFSRHRVMCESHLDLSEVIRKIDSILRPLIGENIELVTALEESPWLVYADPQGLGQVLLNLAVNARDAMPSGGELTVELAKVELESEIHCVIGGTPAPGRYMRLTVSDTGVGIPDEVASDIFKPFFTTRSEGTGLGLATVAKVVIGCDGYLRLQSKVGQGTSFEIFLPASESVDSVESVEQPSYDGGGLGGIGVLVVEDQPLVRKVTGRMLRAAGMKVTLASGGEEALSIVERSDEDEFALVLSDVVMPLMGGEELVRRLRALRPGLQFLLVSGYPDSIDLSNSLEMSVDVLMKPFSAEELTDKARSVLEQD